LSMQFEPVIGLEVHAQMLTSTKIFCNCSTEFGHTQNSLTCPVCLGMPGVLPVLNRKAVEYALRTALATNCRVQFFNQFARKNYFYPDLPKGYQISQFELPIATEGYIEINLEGESRVKKIGITRIHMEEDAGKLTHELEGSSCSGSYVDFNRTGVPLMEIVSEPDIRTPEEAGEYLRSLRIILQYLDVCDGNMEQGSFRCDANVSVRPVGQSMLGTKVEIKNMNSFKHVEKALEYEIERQKIMAEEDEEIVQETRLWDERKDVTFSMRSKEEAHDYRYFPDPDLVPVVIEESFLQEVKENLPELPKDKTERFVQQYNIPEYDAKILSSARHLSDYFEECVKLYNQPKSISNWIMGDVLRCLGDVRDVVSFTITPSHVAGLVELIDNGTISGKIAKTVFAEMQSSGKMPEIIVQEKGLVQMSDENELDLVVMKIIEANEERVQDYRNGREKLFGYFVGQVMKETKGKANPKIVNEILREKLAG